MKRFEGVTGARVLSALILLSTAGAGCGPSGPSSEVLQRAFDTTAAEPLPPPAFGDWLEQHKEAGQTFEQFVQSKPRRVDAQRRKLYFQPLGEFPEGEGVPLEVLQDFASAFFALEVEALPAVPVDGSPITIREAPGMWHRQLFTRDIVAYLHRRVPQDAFAVVSVTLEDLYPDPNWNFVFGQASPHHRVGVYSFARLDPRFYAEDLPDNWHRLLVRRMCKILAHETGHLFGIKHCTAYRCLMNGSNHLDEFDARPLHLCPVDLRKLQHSIGFDPLERYRRLLRFTQAAGFEDESEWLTERIRYVQGDGPV